MYPLQILGSASILPKDNLKINYLDRCDFEANLGDICKICNKGGQFFETHSIISSSFVRLLRCSSIQKSNQGITEMTRPKGAFYTYVDQILPNIHHLPIPICDGIPLPL